jgi:hypothetical protein
VEEDAGADEASDEDSEEDADADDADDALGAELRGVRFALRCSLDARPRCVTPGCPCGGMAQPEAAASAWCVAPLSWRRLLHVCASDERLSPAHATLQLACGRDGGDGEPVLLLPALRCEAPLPGLPELPPAHASDDDDTPAAVEPSWRHVRALLALQQQAAALRGDLTAALAAHAEHAQEAATAGLEPEASRSLSLGARLLHALHADATACAAALAGGGGFSFAEHLTLQTAFPDAVRLGCRLIGALAPALCDEAAELAAAEALGQVILRLHESALVEDVHSAARVLREACEAALVLITRAPAGASRHDVAAAAEAREHHAAAAVLLVLTYDTAVSDSNPNPDGFIHFTSALSQLAARFSLSAAAAAASAADARALSGACRAAGRLFRAVTAHPRTVPGLCAFDEHFSECGGGMSEELCALELALCTLIGTLHVLRDALAAADARTARWVLTYALLPAAFWQLQRSRAQMAGLRRGLRPGPDIARLHVRCAFCVCRACAPRRQHGHAGLVLACVFGGSGLDVVCAAAAAHAACRRPAARLVAHLFQHARADGMRVAATAPVREALLAARVAESTRDASATAAAAAAAAGMPLREGAQLAGLLPPVRDDADEADLLSGGEEDDDCSSVGLSEDDEEDDAAAAASSAPVPPRRRVHTALLLDRALCAVTGAARADALPTLAEQAAAVEAFAGAAQRVKLLTAEIAQLKAQGAAAAATAREMSDALQALQAQTASREAEAAAAHAAAAVRRQKKSAKKQRRKAMAGATAPPPLHAAPAAPPAAAADENSDAAGSDDEEVDAEAMARALRRGGGGARGARGGIAGGGAARAAPPAAAEPAAPPSQQAEARSPDAPAAAASRGARAPLPKPRPAPPPLLPLLPHEQEQQQQQQDDDDDDDALCVCCLDAARDTPLPGCAAAHAPVLCAPCAVAVCARAGPTCPLCRAPVVVVAGAVA